MASLSIHKIPYRVLIPLMNILLALKIDNVITKVSKIKLTSSKITKQNSSKKLNGKVTDDETTSKEKSFKKGSALIVFS